MYIWNRSVPRDLQISITKMADVSVQVVIFELVIPRGCSVHIFPEHAKVLTIY